MKIVGKIVLVFFAVWLHGVALAGPLDNCSEYIKYGIPGEQGDLLCRKGYALAHNPNHKTPDWVTQHLTAAQAGAILTRTDDFRPDPDLLIGRRAELSDYKFSGYDRGHMAPAGDMRWDLDAMSQSFLLSNICPQVGVGMNRNIWADLEGKVRTWAIARGELYIFTGPIYAPGAPLQTIGLNQVAVPTHFYKIAFDPVRVEAIAFIMPNMALSTQDMPKYIVSVRDVELYTGLNFLSNLEEQVQQLVESRVAPGLW